jgi:hypothetical protein
MGKGCTTRPRVVNNCGRDLLGVCNFLRIILRSGSGLRHVIAGTRPSFVALVGNVHADPAEGPILPCVGRPIADLILRSKFVVNIEEAAMGKMLCRLFLLRAS